MTIQQQWLNCAIKMMGTLLVVAIEYLQPVHEEYASAGLSRGDSRQ
ncbi:MAG: hypothetical protein GY796_33445 [Chloroflexi bacterium]|nr:hypothetical protein [Chloroflexota bacterium]